jgi:hypothetical protein
MHYGEAVPFSLQPMKLLLRAPLHYTAWQRFHRAEQAYAPTENLSCSYPRTNVFAVWILTVVTLTESRQTWLDFGVCRVRKNGEHKKVNKYQDLHANASLSEKVAEFIDLRKSMKHNQVSNTIYMDFKDIFFATLPYDTRLLHNNGGKIVVRINSDETINRT